MSYNFNDTYSLDPWDQITLNERTWYDGLLREVYTRQSVYSNHVTMKVDLAAMRARTVVFNDLIPPRPNIGTIGNRDENASRLYTDSYQKQLTVQRYGNGMSLHRESEMFNYWNTNGDYGLRGIINRSLGQVMVDHLDLLAFNAFLTNPYSMFGVGSATGFGGISTSTDKMSTDLLDAIWLGMQDRRVPWAAYANPFDWGDIICITTPGAIYDLRREVTTNALAANQFVNIQNYANPNILTMAGEIGQYRGVRFVQSQLAELWNAGTVTAQTTITAAVAPGDGAPDPSTTSVDSVRYVGQPGATHSIAVASSASFSVGQKLTVHRVRYSGSDGKGVTNGVDITDPMRQDMVIAAIPDSTHISFKEPYMMTDTNTKSGQGLETDLGGGVYGYITLGHNVHTAIFLNQSYKNGVVAGFAQPPRIYTPPPVDDYLSIYRITYDMWTKYALWEPQVFEVAFLAGSNKDKGTVFVR